MDTVRVELRDRAGNVVAFRDFLDWDNAFQVAMSWSTDGLHVQFFRVVRVGRDTALRGEVTGRPGHQPPGPSPRGLGVTA